MKELLLVWILFKMGPAFVILFWLFLLVIFGGIFSLFAGLSFLGKLKKWPLLKWLAGIPAALMALGAIVGVISLIGGIVFGSRPTVVFRNTFGGSPSAQISELQSSIYWFADTGDICLRFKTTREEFQRLIPKGLHSVSPSELDHASPCLLQSNKNAWWTFQINDKWVYYLRQEQHDGSSSPGPRGFYSEEEIFAYDPEHQTAYYHFVGID